MNVFIWWEKNHENLKKISHSFEFVPYSFVSLNTGNEPMEPLAFFFRKKTPTQLDKSTDTIQFCLFITLQGTLKSY